MEVKKYQCHSCQKVFEVASQHKTGEVHCPHCGGQEIAEYAVCSLEAGPPDWEFNCRVCKSVFRIKSPRGPDEVKQVRCPICQGKEVVWVVSATMACGSGG